MFEHFNQKVRSKNVETKITPIIHDPKLIGFGRPAIYRFPRCFWLSVTPNIHEMAAILRTDLAQIAWLGQIPPPGTVNFSP